MEVSHVTVVVVRLGLRSFHENVRVAGSEGTEGRQRTWAWAWAVCGLTIAQAKIPVANAVLASRSALVAPLFGLGRNWVCCAATGPVQPMNAINPLLPRETHLIAEPPILHLHQLSINSLPSTFNVMCTAFHIRDLDSCPLLPNHHTCKAELVYRCFRQRKSLCRSVVAA